MFKLVLGAVFRNEADNMVEYVEHYLFHGVEHLYLINDGSTDNFREVLEPYIERGLVTLFEGNEERTGGRQERVYNKMFLQHLHEAEWWLIADLDEFAYSPKETDLRLVLNTYSQYSYVSAEWLMFGSDGQEAQPPLLVTSFTKRCAAGISYKTFVQSKYLANFGIHIHGLREGAPSGTLLKVDSDGNADIILNHYRQQSLERWMKRVKPRGDGSLSRKECANEFFLGVFYEHNYNDVDDRRLLEQNAPVIERTLGIKNKYQYI